MTRKVEYGPATKYLNPALRKRLILEEIKFYEADILCLQEFEPGFISTTDVNALSPNYESVQYLLPNAEEGVCTTYNKAKFKLIDSVELSLFFNLDSDLFGKWKNCLFLVL